MPYIAGTSTLLDASTVLSYLGLSAGMRIGDLGCGGHGQFTIHAAKTTGAEGVVYAVDILTPALEEIAKKARLEGVRNIKTIWSDLERPEATTIAAGTLDAAYLVNVLFQSRQHGNILKEAARLLTRGGRLLIVDWKNVAAPFGPPKASRVNPDAIIQLAEAAALQLEGTFEAGPYHFGVVFIK